MPKPVTAPNGSRKGKKEPVPQVVDRPVIYPDLEVAICDKDHDGPVTMDQAKTYLGWQSEAEYVEATMAANPGAKPEQCKFDEEAFRKNGIHYPLVFDDVNGERVACWNSAYNRPFGIEWAHSRAQDVLTRSWAGPTTLPGETINGQGAIIGRTGIVTNGNHSLIGLVFACQRWASASEKHHWQELWPEEPVMEMLVIKGVSEDQRVVGTLDQTKSRTLADTFATSELFRDMKRKDKELCSAMLDNALDLLWNRTGAGKSAFSKYQTHSESRGFLDRHPRLLDCIKHLFEENAETKIISKLRLSPGRMAALMYLMGSSTSDPTTYANADPASEEALTWDNWDRASDFIALLGSDPELIHVRAALNALVDPDNNSLGGRWVEKNAILAKAWARFADEKKISADDLELAYHDDDKGIRHLDAEDAVLTFGGIDGGEKPPKEAPAIPTEEEVEAEKKRIEEDKAAARKRSAEAAAEKIRQMRAHKKPSATVAEPGSGKGGQPGKPPPPKAKNRPTTIQQQQTEKARKADEELAKAGNKKAAAALTDSKE